MIKKKVEWKNIPGYEKYQVTKNGEVRSLQRDGSYRILIPFIKKKSLAVRLHKGGKVIKKLVHRLVASAYGLQGKEGEVLYHKDGDLLNNHISNLEWLSRKELGLKTGMSRDKTNRDDYFYTYLK